MRQSFSKYLKRGKKFKKFSKLERQKRSCVLNDELSDDGQYDIEFDYNYDYYDESTSSDDSDDSDVEFYYQLDLKKKLQNTPPNITYYDYKYYKTVSYYRECVRSYSALKNIMLIEMPHNINCTFAVQKATKKISIISENRFELLRLD